MSSGIERFTKTGQLKGRRDHIMPNPPARGRDTGGGGSGSSEKCLFEVEGRNLAWTPLGRDHEIPRPAYSASQLQLRKTIPVQPYEAFQTQRVTYVHT